VPVAKYHNGAEWVPIVRGPVGPTGDTGVETGAVAPADTNKLWLDTTDNTADDAMLAGDDAAALGSGAAASGTVLTADGIGGTDWEAAAGGAELGPWPFVGGDATRYLTIPGVVFGDDGTLGVGGGQRVYSPFVVTEPFTIDALVIEVTTASAVSGAVSQVGIYEADAEWQPTNVAVDGGDFAADTTGVKLLTVSATLQPGRCLTVLRLDFTITGRSVDGNIPGGPIIPTLGTNAPVGTLRVVNDGATPFENNPAKWDNATYLPGPQRYCVFLRPA